MYKALYNTLQMKEQHKRFADKYFETLNASLSAEFSGFSEETARQQGWQLLQREDVQEYLTELRTKSEVRHSISKDRWLSELEAVGFSNIQDFISDSNNIKDFSKLPEYKAKAVSSIKKSVTEFDGGEKVVTEFKLHDKLNALDKIGRHFGYFEKDNDQSKANTTNIINLGGGIKPDEATT